MDRKEYLRQYRLKNKEKIKEQSKEYYENNKEHYKEYHKEYRKTDKDIKTKKISSWKRLGVIHDNFDILYDLYINTNECNICNKGFCDTYDRCLDHDHTNGLFRYVLCRNCNSHDNWKNKV